MYLQPGSYNMYWVTESSILPDIPLDGGGNLRDAVSFKGVSFGQLMRVISDDLYEFRFARSFDHIEDPAYSEQIFLDGDQFARVLPWSKSLEYLPISELREQIEAHVPKDTCTPLIEQEQESSIAPPTAIPSSSLHQEKAELPAHEAVSLEYTEYTVFVSCKSVEETLQAMENSKEAASFKGIRGMRSWLQCGWLRAALNVLLRQITQVSEQFKLCDLKRSLLGIEAAVRRVLISRNRFSQRLVKAEPVYFYKRQIGWHVGVDVPLALVA
jgi:hypothetical protein